MRFIRVLLPIGLFSTAASISCAPGFVPRQEELGTVHEAAVVQKSYSRKVYVHMMPWFQVGGQHWSMNSRNPATGVASWYSPMIGEYSSDDPDVIEYQLLTMKYAGIDGVLIDWPGLAGQADLPRNRANADAIINRTAAFGLSFGVVYEDQYAASIDAASNDMAYVRNNFFSRPNRIEVNGAPAILVFGPQKFNKATDWTTILAAFPTSHMFFPLWYNDNAGTNANGRFAWLAQNALKGIADFDNALDGVDQGWRIPVIYPGFNTYYAQGGWSGPTWTISYTLKPDDTEGGNTFQSTFDLGKYAGDPLQIATWNDYGEGTMVEPTNQFQYQSLMILQKEVGALYTDAELTIVKLLYDQRRQLGASRQALLDQASAALANLDVAGACAILGCTAPVHAGGGSAADAGATRDARATSEGGSTTGPVNVIDSGSRGGAGGATGSTDASGIGGGRTNTSAAGGTSSGGARPTSPTGGAGALGTDASGSGEGERPAPAASGCSVGGATPADPSMFLVPALAFTLAWARRRRPVSLRHQPNERAHHHMLAEIDSTSRSGWIAGSGTAG
jgi:MYXO-CTERM domain-containing protein